MAAMDQQLFAIGEQALDRIAPGLSGQLLKEGE